MRIRVGSAQNIGKREAQQDAFAFSDLQDQGFVSHGGRLAIIADGMGGLEDGGVASRLAVRAFVEAYEKKTAEESVNEALRRSLEEANSRVCEHARLEGLTGNIGTTLSAAVIHSDLLHWISVGDSRIYLLRSGELAQVTSDHIYGVDLDLAASMGLMDASEAENDPQREALTSYIGMERLPKIDFSENPFPVLPADLVMLCSDGVYRAISESEVVDALCDDPAEMCDNLMGRVLGYDLPRQDNATILAVSCESESYRPASRQLTDRRGLLFSIFIGLMVALSLIDMLRSTILQSRPAGQSIGSSEM